MPQERLTVRKIKEIMRLKYGAPRKAWHFFQGESPWWTRPNQPSILSVAVVKEAEVEQYS